jgi:hypothetical protein
MKLSVNVELHPVQSLESVLTPNVWKERKIDNNLAKVLAQIIDYLNTFNTRIVAGELTTDSFRFLASTSGGSSRGLEEAEVAMANAAAAVDVLLLNMKIQKVQTND